MRVAVLSDIHANMPALEASVRAAGGVDGIWHLGDVVGYGPAPDQVVARLQELGVTGVRGNHDAAAIGGPEIDWFNPDARRAMEWTRNSISPSTRAWLTGLPPTAILDECSLVHGSPRDPMWEYITSVPVARANLAALGTRIGLHGHTHVPMAWIEEDGSVDVVGPGDGSILELRGRRALVNPGSVGQPRDGDPRAAFLILDTEKDSISWHRVSYDIQAVQEAMRSAGLPATLVARLDSGS
ncbi:MAG: metallophosphoesterase family protein [Chloroflexi bacterium]|nr:metallophosphoesterase family protein [Chloroflexota bacterium]